MAEQAKPFDTAAASSAKAPPPRPRISPWKAAGVALTLLLLTPVWIAYGFLGKVLTASSKTLSRSGLALLTLLAGVVLLEVYLVEIQHGHTFVEITSADDTDRVRHALEGERDFLQLLALLAFVLAALVVGQWRFHNLVITALDVPITTANGLPLLVDMLAPLFFVALLWEHVFALKHWQFVTGLTISTYSTMALACIIAVVPPPLC